MHRFDILYKAPVVVSIAAGLGVAGLFSVEAPLQNAFADDAKQSIESPALPEGEYSGSVSDGSDTYPIVLSVTNGDTSAIIANDGVHEYSCNLGKAIVTNRYEVIFTEFKYDDTLTWSTDGGSGTSLGTGKVYAILYGRITNTSDEPISLGDTIGSAFIDGANYQVAVIEAVAPDDTSWEEDVILDPLETSQFRLAVRMSIEDDIIGLQSIEFNWDVASINSIDNKIEHDVFIFKKDY